MPTNIDLTNQVQGVLPLEHGGTGNQEANAIGRLILPCMNDTGAALPLGTTVKRTASYSDTRVTQTTSASDIAIGVVVGRLVDGGETFEEVAPDNQDIVAVCIAGRARVLVASAVTHNTFALCSSTSGKAAGSTSKVYGVFGYYESSTAGAGAAMVVVTGSAATQWALEGLLDAKGDIIVASANNTAGRLAVGAYGYVLTADSAETLGVKWVRAGTVFGDLADSAALTPTATITSVKDAGNPTFNFDAIPESVVKVGTTYYAVFQTWTTSPDHISLASATDRDGPWTDLGQIYGLGNISWYGGTIDEIYAPHLMLDAGTFYLFYSLNHAADGTEGVIGYATASVVTGPYTDHGSAILSPGGAGTWDERRVGEPGVINHDGRWIMAYMGESMTGAYGASEKVGIATASSPGGTWTKAAGNPLITFGAGGEWDDTLIADPFLFFEHGYYWIMYSGGGSTIGDGTRPWSLGLAYALDPTGTWTKHADNPFLSNGGAGTWEEKASWRGGLFRENGLYSGVYGGLDNALTTAKGGNFRLVVDVPPASAVSYATPAIVLGTAAAAGAASTVIRSDSTIVAFDATVPAAIGTAATGSQAVAARRDHVHPTGAGTPTTLAFGDAPATGTGPAAAMTDHRHGMPSSAGAGIGEILISDTPSTPLVFADLIQNEAQDDLVYGDP